MPATAPATAAAKAPPRIALRGNLTPGGYMRSCRERAGLSIDACAEKLAIQRHEQRFSARSLQALERNQPGDYGRLVTLLSEKQVFAFDLGTFAKLAAETADPEMEDFGL